MPAEERRRPLEPVVLPQDERPHDRLIEWWHFIGHLATAGDAEPERYSFLVSVMKARVLGLDQIGSVVVLIDERDKTRSIAARAVAAGSAMFEQNDGRCFCFQLGAGPSRPGGPDAWRAAGGMGSYAIDIDTQLQLSLRLEQKTPGVLLGDHGRERYPGGAELGYCAWPHLALNGTIHTGLAQRPVTGRAWMEHQWGDVSVGDYHWKYIALMHGDDRYSFFGVGCGAPVLQDGDFALATTGYRLLPSGRAEPLRDVKLETTDRHFYRGYPLATTVSFQDPRSNGPTSGRLQFRVEPEFEDQFVEGAISPAFFPEFWEGACTVKGPDSQPAWAMTELAGFRKSTR